MSISPRVRLLGAGPPGPGRRRRCSVPGPSGTGARRVAGSASNSHCRSSAGPGHGDLPPAHPSSGGPGWGPC
eukprot:10797521-Alexandrium_andersonii.AAC.1